MTRAGLAWFDLTRGTPAALRVLRRRLGGRRTLRALLGVIWRALLADPLRRLEREGGISRREQLTRQQLRGVLLLDAALREDLRLPPERAHQVLREVVGRSGARFLAWALPPLDRARWAALAPPERERLATGLVDGFFNVEGRVTEVSDAAVGFDVSACLFVSLCAELGRPDLAPLFCHADSVYFDDPAVPIDLVRTNTLARGGGCCDFRLTLSSD